MKYIEKNQVKFSSYTELNILIILFFILYGIWGLPETILVRNLCLIIGSFISLKIIYQNCTFLIRFLPVSAWLIIILFLWAIFHLIFIGENYQIQLTEFQSIWKRSVLAAIFAFGLGLSLAQQNKKNQIRYWYIFYISLLFPVIIYLTKYILTNYGNYWSQDIPDFLKLFPSSAQYFVPKTTYVCFLIPLAAASFSWLYQNISCKKINFLINLIPISAILICIFIFYIENIKNGMLYIYLLLLIFIYMIFMNLKILNSITKVQITIFILLIIIVGLSHIKENKAWLNILADFKVAIQVDNYDYWKYGGDKGYPENELGKTVDKSTYERIAWAKIGIQLLANNPSGYGLIERSFSHLAKQQWLDSNLSQTHSGWLDLALGIGIIGTGLIILAMLLAMFKLIQSSRVTVTSKLENFSNIFNWHQILVWILISCGLMWFTTEISQKVYFEMLIFWISFCSGFLFYFNITCKNNY